MNQKIEKARKFLLEDLWRVTSRDMEKMTPLRRFLYRNLKRVDLAVQRFLKDKMFDRASALTYTTLLALVPILAFLFALTRGFGFDKMTEAFIRSHFQGHDEVLNMLMNAINTYLEHAKSGVFIGVGLVFLFYTIISLTSDIESAFNQIWQRHGRSALRKITDYISVMVLVPFLWVIITGLTVFLSTLASHVPDFMGLNHTAKFFINLLPFLFIGLSFTGLYVFMPNTHVKLKYAILPGFLAGAAFVGLQYFYINSQIWVSNYNAIYGSFAALPMFLIWAQISWCICLFGAELTYASQNVDVYNFEYDVRHASRKHNDFVTLLLLSTICKRFQEKGAKPYTASRLSHELSLPLRMVNDKLNMLVKYRWLSSSVHEGKDECFQPACDLSQITVGAVLSQIYNHGEGDLKLDYKKYGPQIEKFRQAVEKFDEVDKDMLLTDF